MNYRLHRISLQLQACNNEPATTAKTSRLHNILSELESIESALLIYLSAMQSAEQLAIALNTTATSCTHILNLLYTIRHHNADSLPEAQTIRQQLIKLLAFMQTHFARQFNTNKPVPLCCKDKQAYTWSKEKDNYIAALQSTGCQPELIQVITRSIDHLLKQPSLTWAQLHWIKRFRQHIQKLSNGSPRHNSNWLLVKWLLANGFNAAGFMQYIITLCREEALQADSIQAQLAYWGARQTQVHFITSFAAEPLYTTQPSLHHTLNSYINKEKAGLEKQLQTPATTTVCPTIQTDLSVAQLAVLLKLLFDNNIIRHNNQKEFLGWVATAVKTGKTATISKESLRTKYYAPEPAALRAVKDLLFSMIKTMH